MLFEGCPNWTLRNRLRVVRRYRIAALREMARIDAASRRFSQAFRCSYVLVEPIMHPELLDFARRTPSLLVGGVTSCAATGSMTLLMANDSLGNSIVPSKPGLSGNVKATFNYNFPSLYEFVVSTFIDSGHCEKILLRMNAEGVEGPILDYLASHKTKPAVLAGSIGDIRKCFGDEEYERSRDVLNEADIPYIYLTSHPQYWASGMENLISALCPPDSHGNVSEGLSNRN